MEMVNKRVQYELCPECTPNPTRRGKVTRSVAPPALPVTSPISSVSEDDVFMNEQIAMLPKSKELHRIYQQRSKLLEIRSKDPVEVAKYKSVQAQYMDMIRSMTPTYPPIEPFTGNPPDLSSIPLSYPARERIQEYLLSSAHNIAVYRRSYHRKIIELRLDFMSRKFTRLEWRKRALAIQSEYKSFEIDVLCALGIGRDLYAIRHPSNDMAARIEEIRNKWNTQLIALHTPLGRPFDILNSEWHAIRHVSK